MIKKHLELLGHEVEDKVTKVRGVVTSVGFDLYGCVQAVVHPGIDKEGKPKESAWFDIARLTRLSEQPVMQQPNFEIGIQAEGLKGAADKPSPSKF